MSCPAHPEQLNRNCIRCLNEALDERDVELDARDKEIKRMADVIEGAIYSVLHNDRRSLWALRWGMRRRT
jgi:hypothetical protein